jgi:hypothetical protein
VRPLGLERRFSLGNGGGELPQTLLGNGEFLLVLLKALLGLAVLGLQLLLLALLLLGLQLRFPMLLAGFDQGLGGDFDRCTGRRNALVTVGQNLAEFT